MAGPELSVLAVCDGRTRRRARPGPGLQAGPRRRRRPQHRRHGRLLAGAGRRRRASSTTSSTASSSRPSPSSAAGASTTGAPSTPASCSPPDGPEAASSTTSASATPRPRSCCPGSRTDLAELLAAAAAGDLGGRHRGSSTTPPCASCSPARATPRRPRTGARIDGLDDGRAPCRASSGLPRRRRPRRRRHARHRRRPGARRRRASAPTIAEARDRPTPPPAGSAGPASTSVTTSRLEAATHMSVQGRGPDGVAERRRQDEAGVARRSSASASRPTSGCCRPTARPAEVAEFASAARADGYAAIICGAGHGRPPRRCRRRPDDAAGRRRAAVGRRAQRRRRPLRHRADAQGHPRGDRRRRRRR